MKTKSTYIILICIIICALLSNIRLLYLYKQNNIRMEAILKTMEHLTEIEFMHNISKELTISRITYEQHDISNAYIYIGSDKNALLPVSNIINRPKLVLGLNQNMCAPCILGVLDNIKEIFSDKDLVVKILFVTDKTSPDLTKEYLKIIRERYRDL